MTFYVYELVAADSGRVFYVGKGTGNRMLHHHRVLSRPHLKEHKRPVYERMRDLLLGEKFFARKVFETHDEIEALKEEARRISEIGFDNLANTQSHAFTGRKLKPEVGRLISRKLQNYSANCRKSYGKGCTPEVSLSLQRSAKVRIERCRAIYGTAFPPTVIGKLKQAWKDGRMADTGATFRRLNAARVGTKQTPEHVANAAVKRLGRKLGPYKTVTKRLCPGASGFVGVTQKAGRYVARVCDGVKKRLFSLGSFTLAIDAARAVDDAYFVLHSLRPNATEPGKIIQGRVLDLAETRAEHLQDYVDYARRCRFIVMSKPPSAYRRVT